MSMLSEMGIAWKCDILKYYEKGVDDELKKLKQQIIWENWNDKHSQQIKKNSKISFQNYSYRLVYRLSMP